MIEILSALSQSVWIFVINNLVIY